MGLTTHRGKTGMREDGKTTLPSCDTYDTVCVFVVTKKQSGSKCVKLIQVVSLRSKTLHFFRPLIAESDFVLL